MRSRWDEHCENGRAHCNTSKFFSLPCVCAPRAAGLQQESYYDYDYYLNSRLMRARAAQVRAWRRHYVLIIIFNYLLRTTRAGIPNREREQAVHAFVPIVFLLHLLHAARRSFAHIKNRPNKTFGAIVLLLMLTSEP